ncbi:MAG TPA: DUF2147 domain-containing protein [Mucilaginibacter sp.]|jgi:uncharacterized protein (DUF2147 family)|nr:DUF2147 domain-containing protein [Mucilaginibacter sp.]
MLKCLAFVFLLATNTLHRSLTVPACDRICGKWMSAEKNLIVLVYKSGDEFKGKIIWFRDDPSLPMDEWKDKNNPDPALRSRKILGMEILRDIKYDADDHSWGDGMIYDAKHGREWNASAYINKDGLLKVKGYWHFKFIGRTMTFHRV